MNYVLKLHPSNSVFESFVNNAKRSDRKRYICGHCLNRHTVVRNNVRELSTYHSALKLMLKRKQKLENSPSVKAKLINKTIQNGKENTNKFTELVKVSRKCSKETRMTVQKIQASEVSAFAEKPGMTFSYDSKCAYGSTRTYDPNVLMPIQGIKEFEEDAVTNTKIPMSEVNGQLYPRNTLKTDTGRKYLPKKERSNFQEFSANVKSKTALKGRTALLGESKENLNSGIINILPLSAVKILPMPKRFHNNFKTSGNLELMRNVQEKKSFMKPYTATVSKRLPQTNGRVEEWLTFQESTSIREIQGDMSPREHDFMLLLHSYIDVSINNNMLQDALRILHVCRKKDVWQNATQKSNVVDIYNSILHGYSIKGDWTVVSLITEWMELDQAKFNCQTYAALLDCLARVNKSVFQSPELWKQQVVKIIKDIYESKYSLNDLFTQTLLPKDKKDKILGLIREVLPYFEIEPTRIKLSSNCPLLRNLHREYNRLQSPIGTEVSANTVEKFVEEQLLIEKNFNVQVKAIARGKNSNISLKNKEKFEDLNEEWRKSIREGFRRKLKITELEHKKPTAKFNLYVYLKCLPEETFVDVMMHTVQSLLEYSASYSPSTLILYRNLGDNIQRRYKTNKQIKTGVYDKIKDLFKKYCSWYVDPVGPARNSRQEWQMLVHDLMEGHGLGTKNIKWPEEVKGALGKYLFDIILRNVTINLRSTTEGLNQMVPAFYLVVRCKKNKSIEELKCHPSLAKLFRNVGYEYLNFDADQIPMICPPKPWMDVSHGGYLMLPTDFVRRPEGFLNKLFDFKKIPSQQLYATYDSLNFLQGVPWVVNESVLDVVMEVFRNGGSTKLNVPHLPDSEPVKPNITLEMTADERREEYLKSDRILKERQNEYGLWCETLYRLSLAEHFRKKVFWLPQNFDFRGRVYPVPPHLNHLGADLFRSLLLFAKSKPLGPTGLDWLKIHTINLTGTHKRRPVKERLEHANRMLPEIVDSARRPLTGNKWWTESEEPWQTLAVCKEIENALRCPNPEYYMSKFPVHQDGSCNGLQHYAALGRDKIGAESVNLAPAREPQDVYTFVTNLIERERIKDAGNGDETAAILEGFVKRKVVKQTIMTTVYGVTLYGARLQIAGQLEDIPEFPKEHVWKAAGYLTKKTFQSLQEMFTSAKEIQDWLIKCAEAFCKNKQYIQWISPIGLPIVQPYTRMVKGSQKNLGNSVMYLPNSLKHKNAFPPNFVHSLDSCHMMLTSLSCEQVGLTFASIHDCFWTHPSTVHVMNKICREQFVSLHSQNILEDLSAFFVSIYDGNNERLKKEALETFKAVPKTGDFNLKDVLNSVYFFS